MPGALPSSCPQADGRATLRGSTVRAGWGSRAAVRRLVGLCVIGLALMAVPRSAGAAVDTGVLTGPEDGSAHLIGYTGPVSVDFTGVSMTGVYTISVTGPEGYSWQ